MKSLVMCILVLAVAFAPVEATVIHTVMVEDPVGTYAPFHGPVGTSLLTAGQEWSQALAGSGIIDVAVGFDPRIRTAQGVSTTSQVVDAAGPLRVVEPGAASEMTNDDIEKIAYIVTVESAPLADVLAPQGAA